MAGRRKTAQPRAQRSAAGLEGHQDGTGTITPDETQATPASSITPTTPIVAQSNDRSPEQSGILGQAASQEPIASLPQFTDKQRLSIARMVRQGYPGGAIKRYGVTRQQADQIADEVLPREPAPVEFEVEQPKPRRRVGAAILAASRKARDEQAHQTGVVLLTLLEGLVVSAFGAECAMPAESRTMIQEPLFRILARLSPEVSALIEKYSDPLLLTMGLFTWAAHIWSVLALRVEEAKEEQPKTNTGEPTPPGLNPSLFQNDHHVSPPMPQTEVLA